MFRHLPILIVEDEPLIGLALADAVLDGDGRPIGPVPTVTEALEIIDCHAVGAAIVDGSLADRDVTPVVLRLLETGTPFVIFTGTGLPAELAERAADVVVVMKPLPAPEVVEHLQSVIDRRHPR